MGPLCRVTFGGMGLPPFDTGMMCGGVAGLDPSTTDTRLFDSTWVAWGIALAHLSVPQPPWALQWGFLT